MTADTPHELILPEDPQAAVLAGIDAAESGDVNRLAALLAKYPSMVNERGRHPKTTALQAASCRSHSAVVELLLRHGAAPNMRDESDNAYPLHYAAERGDMAIVQLLVEHGADVDGVGDGHGLSVIGWATCFGRTHVDVAEYLLSKGAKPHMFSAVALGDAATVRRLAGENPRAVDEPPPSPWEAHQRPLYIALTKKRPEMVALLLELGASPAITDNRGFTALDHAALRGDAASIRLLMARGAALELPAALALGREDVYRAQLRDHPDALQPGGRYARLLFYSAGFADGPFVEQLITLGARVNGTVDDADATVRGATPLHWAAFNGNLDAVRVLVSHGADLTIADAVWKSAPLGWAKWNRQHAAATLLESLGAR